VGFFLFCLQITQCYFEGGFQETPVYILTDLKAGHVIRGPAIIMNDTRYFSITHKVFPYYTQDISVLHTRYFSITHKVFQYYTQCISVLHTVFQNNTLYMNIWFNVCNLFVLVIITAVILIIWLVECWLLEVQQQIFYLGGLLLHVFQPQKNLFHYYL
jgi:hypothetical protein